MNPTNLNPSHTQIQIEKVNRANQITTYREPTTWIEISEDQLPEDLRTDDNEPKVIEFCKIIKGHGSDNLTIFKEQLICNNGPPEASLPPSAHRCIFWKEIDLSPQVSQSIIQQRYTVIDTMDPNDEDLSIESCEEIHKQYAQKLNKCSIDAQVACAMSQEFLELLKHIIDQGPKGQNQGRQNAMRSPELRNVETEVNIQTTSYRTYKYEQDFGRVIEAYPMSFEWFPKKTDDNENSLNHNNSTTKGTPLENKSNDNIPLDSAHSTAIKNICHHKKSESPPSCPPPPCPPPPCPVPPPCPPQSCDPENLKIKCSSGDIDFKLKCRKLPIDCQNTDVRYECQLMDEGKCIDSKILESCDLKCERIELIHSGEPRIFEEALEDVNNPIIVKEIEDKKDDNKMTKRVSTMICSKDGVNFNLKCTRTAPDPDFPSDVRFICEIGDDGSGTKISSAEIMSTPIRCKQVCNVVDESVLGDENSNNHCINEKETKNDNNPIQCLEEKDNKSKRKTEQKKIYACRSKPKIEKEEYECIKNDPNESADFVDPEDETCEQIISVEHLKLAFLENHNKTMDILRAATNDLICTITDATRELCEDNTTKSSIKDYTNMDKFERINAAKESCEKLIESVYQGTKELRRLSRETLDELVDQSKKYICSEKECRNEELSNRNLRKINGNSSPDDCIKVINKSVKNINNDMANKNIFEDEQSQKRDELKKNKPSVVEIINENSKLIQEELGIVETMTTVKKSCEDLYDQLCETTQELSANTSKAFNEISSKSMKWFDSPDGKEMSTGYKNIKKVLSGLTVFQNDENSELEENVRPNKWKDSINYALTSLGETFKEIRSDTLEKSSPYDKPSPPRQIKYDNESEEPTPISNMFATLKEKICSMFYDHNGSETTSASSSLCDVSDLSDDNDAI